jgi:hypothetical protein
MPGTPPQSLCLILILGYLAATCIYAVVKNKTGQGRFIWALVIGASLLQLSFDRTNFGILMREGGPVEWASFYAFLFASISFFLRAWQSRASAGRLQFLSLFCLGLFCFFCAGEEISWAQRLFGFKPPEIFLETNYQLEANVHNILKGRNLGGFPLETKNLMMLVACLFGALLPLLKYAFPRNIKPIAAAIPDIRFLGLFLMLAWVEWYYPITFTGEAAELYLGCLLLLSQSTTPQRKNHLIIAGIIFLGTITPLALNQILYSGSEARVVMADKELKQLEVDLFKTGVLQKRLFKKSSVHQRIFTAEKKGYIKISTPTQFLNGQPSALHPQGRKDRFGYYLDPWNNPYWIKFMRRQRRIIIYSFGPNRSRDINFDRGITNNGDDISLVYKIPRKKKPKQSN